MTQQRLRLRMSGTLLEDDRGEAGRGPRLPGGCPQREPRTDRRPRARGRRRHRDSATGQPPPEARPLRMEPHQVRPPPSRRLAHGAGRLRARPPLLKRPALGARPGRAAAKADAAGEPPGGMAGEPRHGKPPPHRRRGQRVGPATAIGPHQSRSRTRRIRPRGRDGSTTGYGSGGLPSGIATPTSH